MIQQNPPAEIPPVRLREHLLVLALGVLFVLCVFAALPRVATDRTHFRPAVGRLLGSLGVDQYWAMFTLYDWEIPDLRIVALDDSGTGRDVTGTMREQGWLYDQLLDDRVVIGDLKLARNLQPAVMDSYANAVHRRLGPEVRRIRFEAVYRTAKFRRSSAGDFTSAVIPLAVYTRSTEGRLEKD